jgi:hypothetical protein
MPARSVVVVCAVPTAAALIWLCAGCAGRETKDEAASHTGKDTPARSSRPIESSRKPAAQAPPAASARPNEASAPAAKGRVHAKTRFVWIRLEPDTSKGWIGYLWIGGSAPLKTGKKRWGYGCTTWYEIEPRGFVCVDGRSATLDPNDPVLARLKPYAPKLDSPWPHHYSESRGAPRYDSLPSADEQRRREWDLADQLKRVEAAKNGDAHQLLDGVDLSAAKDEPIDLGPMPVALHENRRRYQPLSTVAWSHQVFDGNRSWLLTHDYTWVPKDRVVPYPEVHFKGVRIGQDARMPLAFFRGKDRAKYEKTPAGELVETPALWQRLSRVELTGNEMKWKNETYLETRDKAFWLKESDAVVPKLRETTPWGGVVGSDAAPEPGKRRTWMEASVFKGWLIAYENTRPVYVTMISPGRGGTPIAGKDPLETASTPTGTFNITGKFATATMEAPNEFIHSDVPWTQNFSGPHALHGAYWHDDWGNRKSAGCINVSPIDGRWLYEYSEPRAPEGWHGVRWRPEAEPSTLFIVHE